MPKVMYNFRSLSKLCIFIVIFHATPAASRENFCFTPKFLESSWFDHRPDLKVNITFSNQGFIRYLSWIERDIIAPAGRLLIVQKDCCDKTTTLYNLTARLCDIQLFIGKLPMFKETVMKAFNKGNYTFECPLKRGFYVLDNIRIHSRNPILSFMYRPNRTFTFVGGLYEAATNNSLLPLSTYRFTVKLVKKLCKES